MQEEPQWTAILLAYTNRSVDAFVAFHGIANSHVVPQAFRNFVSFTSHSSPGLHPSFHNIRLQNNIKQVASRNNLMQWIEENFFGIPRPDHDYELGLEQRSCQRRGP